jgi:moderate conductance mechanosensitive channel
VGPWGQRALLANVLYRIADVWHVLAIAAIAVLFVMWFVSPADGGRALPWGWPCHLRHHRGAAGRTRVRSGGGAGFRVPPISARFPGFEQRANRYVSLIRWTGSIIIWGVALVVILAGWGLDSVGWITAGAGARSWAR